MYTHRNKFWPAYTWKVQTSYSADIKNIILSEFNISSIDLDKLYYDIFDKINASFYHLERLKENEELAVQVGKALATFEMPGTDGMTGIAASPYEPIGYEYEAFLVTIKSALDFIAILLARGLNRSEDNIIELCNNIPLSGIDPALLEGKIYMLLKSSQFSSFLNDYKNKGDQKSKRNFATHKGSLPIGTINIPINNPQGTILLSKVLDPNNPNSYSSIQQEQNLVEYCEDHFYKTCDFVIAILSLITNISLQSGPKGSIYEQKINKKS